MKKEPVIVHFVPDEGMLDIQIGHDYLQITGFGKGTVTGNPDREIHTAVLSDAAQLKIIKKLVNNLPE